MHDDALGENMMAMKKLKIMFEQLGNVLALVFNLGFRGVHVVFLSHS